MAKLKHVAYIAPNGRSTAPQAVRGFVAYAQRAGNWNLFVVDEPNCDLPDFNAWHGDGVIACFERPRVAEAVNELTIPVVGFEGIVKWNPKFGRIPHVLPNHTGIGRMGAEHLLDQGYTQLAYCGLPCKRFAHWAVERGKGFAARAKEAGVPCSMYTGRYSSPHQWPQLEPDLIEWLESLPKPVGVMASEDRRARQVLQACQSADLHVPEDVAVLGVDNDEIMCDVTIPPLSSVDAGWHRMGYEAAELLDRLMDGDTDTQQETIIEPEGVVARQSTDALAVEDEDVAAALRLIREGAYRGIDADEVADAVGISRTTLYKRFRVVYRRTIHAEVQRVQIERARELARTTELPLKQIAAEAGFANTEHMSRLFRQHLGRTPGSFRL